MRALESTRNCRYRRHRAQRWLAAVLALLGVFALAPASAQAHAFLISSSPEQGARLARAPSVITLTFSEPVVAGSERVTVRRGDGSTVPTPAPVQRGVVVRQAVPAGLRGILVISWRVLADDGHLTAGEFAFAIGAAGPLPSISTATVASTPPEEVVFSLLVFVGLALALGGAVSESVIWRPPLAAGRRAPLGIGVLLVLVGGLGQLVLVAGERAGGGFGAGLRPDRLGTAVGSRPGLLTLVVIASALAAGALIALRRRPLVAPTVLCAVVAVSLRGHAGTSGHGWAVIADVLHLAGVALWVGALAHLVAVVRSRYLRDDAALAVRRYSALALPTVLVILWAGALDALAELTSPADLVNTAYGRTLLVKGGLIALALALALGSRLSALPTHRTVRFGLLRRLTRAEVGVLLAALVVVSLLVNAAPPRSSAEAPRAPTSLVLGPPPLSGPTLQLADLAGLGTVVGLTAAPDDLRFQILKIEDPAPAGTYITASASGTGPPADLYPRPCGPGCFEIHYRLRPGTTRLTVRVAIPDWPAGSARFEIPWPPRPAQPALLGRIVSAMRSVPDLVLTERGSSGPRASARPGTYRISGRVFIAQEPYGTGAVDVRPLDRAPPYRHLAFALPGSNIWVRMTIDAQYRIRRETLVTPGHLIERTFTYPSP